MPTEERSRVPIIPRSPQFWGILLLGLVLRLWGLASQSLWYDEGASLFLRRYATLSTDLFNQALTTEPPVMAILARIWYGLVQALNLDVTSPANDFMIRLLPCGLSVLTLFALYHLVRYLFQREDAAWIAMLFFAINPHQIHYAQEFRIYAFMTLLGVAACYFMLRALDEDRPQFWLAMVFCLAVMMYSHFVSAFYIFAFNVYYLTFLARERRHFIKWTAWMGLLMVLIAPALKLALGMNKFMNMVSVSWFPKPTIKTVLISYKNLFASYNDTALAYWPLFFLAAALMFLGALALFKHGRRAWCILTLATVPVILAYIKWNMDPFCFYEHRLFTLIGVFAILAVVQGILILPHPLLRHGTVALFVLLTVPNLLAHYEHRLHPIIQHRQGAHAKADLRSVAAILQEQAKPGEMITTASHYALYTIFHYSPQLDIRHTRIQQDARKQFTANMGNPNLLRNHRLMPDNVYEITWDQDKVWFVETHGSTFEWKPHAERLRNWFQRHWTETQTHSMDSATLRCFERNEKTAIAFDTPPNVVFLCIDTLRADRVHGQRNGVPIMPNLAQYATEGLDFQEALSPSSWTRTAMASIFSGRYVDAHGVYWSASLDDSGPTTDRLPECITTLPEWFEEKGYLLWGMQTNANLTQELGFAQGFDTDRYLFSNGAPAPEVNRASVQALQELDPPFFLYAHYMDPHSPYNSHPESEALFGPQPELTPADKSNFAQFPSFFADEVSHGLGDARKHKTPRMSPAGRETVLRRYDGEAHYLDTYLGNLIEHIRGSYPDTLFVIFSDHGEEFWEHDAMGHGITLYDETLHVPFILLGPGIPTKAITKPVSTIDIPRTLAGYLGYDPEPEWEGVNLLDAVPANRELFARTKGSWAAEHTDLEMVRQGNHKLIRDFCRNTVTLYDVASDGTEQSPLDNAHPARTPLLNALDAHGQHNQAVQIDCEEEATGILSPERQAELEALGYLAGSDGDNPCVTNEASTDLPL